MSQSRFTRSKRIRPTPASPQLAPTIRDRNLAATLPGRREPQQTGDNNILHAGDLVADTYRVRDLLGEGGMGQVFEAEDLLLWRRVALKVAWPSTEMSFLQREAQAMAAIRHPSMPAIYFMGRHAGIPFVVMERIYGRSLRAHLEQRKKSHEKFTVEEVVDALAQLAEGLAHVHRAGMAHRDLKPENVVLAPGNRVVILDFGLALPEVCRDSSTAGSPSYMAPETIRHQVAVGQSHLVDLYALGVIGYELLTGEKPFQSADLMSLLTQHLVMPAPDLTDLRPETPEPLARIIRDLLSKDPQQRPASADDVSRHIRGLLSPPRPSSSPRPPSVLVVDDDEHLAKVLSFYVRRAVPDAMIEVVGDGEQALARVLANPPDIMLLDLAMPRVNGIEVCMYLRGTHHADSCNIVFVSAAAQERDVQLLQSLGIRYFIGKGPGLGAEICGLMEHLLGDRASRDASQGPPSSRR